MLMQLLKKIYDKTIFFLKNLFFKNLEIVSDFFIKIILFFVFFYKFFKKYIVNSKFQIFYDKFEKTNKKFKEINIFDKQIFQKIWPQETMGKFCKTRSSIQKKFDFDKLFFIEKCFKQKNKIFFFEFIENFNKYIKIEDKNDSNDLKNIIFFDLNLLNEDVYEKLLYIEGNEQESEFFQILELEVLIQINFMIFGIFYLIFEKIFEFIPKTFIKMENLTNIIDINDRNAIFETEFAFG